MAHVFSFRGCTVINNSVWIFVDLNGYLCWTLAGLWEKFCGHMLLFILHFHLFLMGMNFTFIWHLLILRWFAISLVCKWSRCPFAFYRSITASLDLFLILTPKCWTCGQFFFFFFLSADLINGQLTTAECTACQPPLWLGGSPPFSGLGLLCSRFLPSFLHLSVSASACTSRVREGKEEREEGGNRERQERHLKKKGRKAFIQLMKNAKTV